jgi:hypothetical protein
LTQLTIVSNRLTTLIQELAVQQARGATHRRAGTADEWLAVASLGLFFMRSPRLRYGLPLPRHLPGQPYMAEMQVGVFEGMQQRNLSTRMRQWGQQFSGGVLFGCGPLDAAGSLARGLLP